MYKVCILFLNGGNPSTAVLPTEIFCNAGVLWHLLGREPVSPIFKVTTASLDGQAVRCSRQVTLSPEYAYSAIKDPDLVFVPAGGLELDTLVAGEGRLEKVIEQNKETINWLRHWADNGAHIAAACAGVALVAASGLLDGKQGTTHWGLADYYREYFPAVNWCPEYMVTDAGNIYCSGGVNAAADLALYLVEKFGGREAAVQCAKSLLIEMPRTWQNIYSRLPIRNAHKDQAIFHAQEWIQTHFSEDVRFELLAEEIGMSTRNFSRRFKEATGDTPINYLHSLRIATAKRLLETTRMTIQTIAGEVGYIDLLFFRRLFKRHSGLTPTDYRKRFGTKNAHTS